MLACGRSRLAFTPDDTATAMKPFRLGPYLLLEQIGKGGMAQVYRAQWIADDDGDDDDKLVMSAAIKIMRPEFAANRELQQMFRTEARVSMLISHANICRVLPPGPGPHTYMAMEWINGMNLADLNHRFQLSSQLFPYDVIKYIIQSILLALDAAHTLVRAGKPFPIIHRDVSPQNVMVSVRGEVKLMDFGIARVLVDVTSPAAYAGKLRYSPRDQVAGNITPATDLYAVGALLHELVEGSLFRADCLTKAEMLDEIKRGRVPMLTRPKVPDELRKLHKVLLQPNPEDRSQTARDALAVLGPVVDQHEKLAKNVAAQLGSLAKRSGSTLGDGDYEISPEIVSLPDPVSAQQVDEPPSAPKARKGVIEGDVIERTSTAVVSNRGSVRPDPEMDMAGVIPQPRERPRGRWLRVGELGGESPEPTPRVDRPIEQGDGNEAQVSDDDITLTQGADPHVKGDR